MGGSQKKFDADRYKQTTREQWNTAAGAWHKWGPLLGDWLGPSTEIMLDMASVEAGSRVLDVAAGAGEQTLAIARRIGPGGHVMATDLSPAILEFAASSAAEAGFDNVTTLEVDGENLSDLDAGSYDAVVSRVGNIYFPDQQKALRGMKHVLREGGKVAVMVYSTAEKNEFFSMPVSVIRRRANLPAPLQGQPGPFSLGSSGVLEEALTSAGFRDVEIRVIDAPVQLKSASECLQFEKESFGALHQMLSGLSNSEKEEAWAEINEKLCEFESDGSFRGPCEMIVAVGTK